MLLKKSVKQTEHSCGMISLKYLFEVLFSEITMKENKLFLKFFLVAKKVPQFIGREKFKIGVVF